MWASSHMVWVMQNAGIRGIGLLEVRESFELKRG